MSIEIEYKKRNKTLFDSQRIVDYVAEGILLDLEEQQHEYVAPTPVRQFVHEATKQSLRKKFCRPGARPKALERAAYEKFQSVVDHLGDFGEIGADRGPTWRGTPWLNQKLYIAKTLIHHILGEFSMDRWFTACKHSHGTSQGVAFSDTSLEAKWGLPLTCTKRVKPLFEEYLRYDGQLKHALVEANKSPLWDGWYDIVKGSRACTVAKNDEIDRMIAIEPTLNMFFQQGLMVMMYDRLAALGFDVRTLPQEHTFKAFMASIHGGDATVDWRSASDCVLVWLVKGLFPPSWFWAIDIVRCPVMEIGGNDLELPMISTMGNATTFPIETLVFLALAIACQVDQPTVWGDLSQFRCSVFGDDCIVPVESAAEFIDLCSAVGMSYNEDKTFLDGPFRESCGGDYYHGYDVRPLYLRGPVSETKNSVVAWLHTILNGVTKKYIQYFGTLRYLYDKHVFRRIFEVLGLMGAKISFVPANSPDDSGWYCPDVQRFKACYTFEHYPISVGIHGSVMYHYLRFVYGGKRSKRNDWVRYCTVLKRGGSVASFSLYARHQRRHGRYVASIGLSAHWAVM